MKLKIVNDETFLLAVNSMKVRDIKINKIDVAKRMIVFNRDGRFTTMLKDFKEIGIDLLKFVGA